MLATASAVAAQITLPPSSASLAADIPLPVPIWKSVLLMDGQLTPYRASILLFLLAIFMTIIAFWGKSIKQLPWKKLIFAKTGIENSENEKYLNLNLHLGEEQSRIEINLIGSPQLWRKNLISISFFALSFVLSIVTFILFRMFTETNLGLAFWMVSLTILLASASIRSFYQSNMGPYHWVDYFRAGISIIYCLLTFFLLTIGNAWGILTWLLCVATIFSWKVKRNKKPHSNPEPETSSKSLIQEETLQETGPVIKTSELFIQKPGAAGLLHLKQKGQDIFRIISTQLEIIIFIILIGMGAFFRLGNIFDLAPGLNNDVAMLIGVATQLFQGKVAYTPFSSIGWGFETLFLYVIALWIHIVGPNFLAARFASASVGIITLIVAYLLARQVAGKRVAWISTALLAASGYHIIFSDLGSRLIFQPLLEAASFWLLWLALEKRKYWLFILTGISLGFTIQAYNASVFYPFLFVIFFIYLIIRKWKKRKSFIQKYLIGAVIILVAFFITAAPLLGYISNNWDTYRARSNSLLVLYRMQDSEKTHPGTFWSPLVRSLVVGSLIFNQRGNSNDLYIEESALDFPVTILFVLAFAFTLRFWKKPLPFFLLTWFFLGLSAGYVSEPNANRSIGSFIPIYLMCGIFLSAFINFMDERFKKDGGFISGSVVTILIVIVTIAFTYRDYVGPNYKYRWGYAERSTGVGVYVDQLRTKNNPIYITDSYFVTDTVRMMSYKSGEDYYTKPYTRLSMYDVLAEGFPDRSDVAVVVGDWPEDELAKDILLKIYPQSKLEIIPKIDTHWDFEKNVGYGLIIPQNDLQSPTILDEGLLSQYYKEWDGKGEPFQKFVDPLLVLPVQPDPEGAIFSTIWTGTFVIETAGEYGFQLRSNNRSQLYIDDQPIVEITTFNKDDPEMDQIADGLVELPQGSHRIKIVYNYEGGNIRLGVLWKIPGADYNWLQARNFSP